MPTLEWIGKDKVVNHHQEVPYRVLERQYSYDETGQHAEDNGSENMIIHGDNLEALKALLPRYEGKVKCIYIDKTTPRLIQFHILKNAVNPPFLGGFLFSPLWRHRQNGILARTDYTFWRYSVTIEKLSLQSRAIVKMYKNVRVRLKGLTLD